MKNKNILNIVIYVIIGLIVIVSILLIINMNNNENTDIKDEIIENSYQAKEKEIIEKAKEYISNRYLSVNGEKYYSASTINVQLPSDCSKYSGVIVKDGVYKAYLSCTGYESKIVDNPSISNFKMIGNEVYFHALGRDYYDPGYVGSGNAFTIGSVPNTEGVYNITYVISESNYSPVRKVIVVNDQELYNKYPTIELNGNDTIEVAEKTLYEELGAKASDTIDGDITNNIRIIGEVNLNEEGEYTLTYVVTNSRNYASGVKRIVKVVDKKGNLKVNSSINPSTDTRENVTIHISIPDDNFKSILLPDSTIKYDKEIDYIAKENGIYVFYVYDKVGRRQEERVTVTNIDRTIPNASCKIEVHQSYSVFTVTSKNKRPLKSFQYFINGKSMQTSSNNSISLNTSSVSSASVIIKDDINNQNTINCTIIEKKGYDPISSNTIKGSLLAEYNSNTLKYWIERWNGNDYAHIWVEDAVNQARTAIPNIGTTYSAEDMLNSEINNYGYANKGLVAVNGSFFANGKPDCYLTLSQGKIIQDLDTRVSNNFGIYGIKGDGNLDFWTMGGDDSNRINNRATIINSGVKNTICGSGVILERNGRVPGAPGSPGGTNRTVLCQINQNNFILVSGSGDQSYFGEVLRDSFGCQYAVNFDGGGSRKLYYKYANGGLNKVFGGSRKLPDMFYFVEK